MKIKNVLLLVTALTLFGCGDDDHDPKCNCGTIKSQGFYPWATPGYWLFIKNDCTGNSTTFYFRSSQGKSIGDHFCLPEGTTW